MNYKTIESYFMSEEGVQELLDLYTPQFNEVQEIADKLISGQIMTKEEIDLSLSKITGLYMTLNIVTVIADTAKKQEEGKRNFQRIQEFETAKKKPVQSAIDKLVFSDVQYLRRVRNIFQAYRGSAEKGMGSAQSRLSAIKRVNMNNAPEIQSEE